MDASDGAGVAVIDGGEGRPEESEVLSSRPPVYWFLLNAQPLSVSLPLARRSSPGDNLQAVRGPSAHVFIPAAAAGARQPGDLPLPTSADQSAGSADL